MEVREVYVKIDEEVNAENIIEFADFWSKVISGEIVESEYVMLYVDKNNKVVQ